MAPKGRKKSGAKAKAKPRAKTKTPEQLAEYERKRDFGKTAEPAPKRRRNKKGAPRFVVHEHSARRLHWDLRLEHEGVAASWAIPNGIPETPEENRKAVHTEDHPLEYLEWEGEIPHGEYGAGTMTIWDSGTYELEKWERGKVMVEFQGERLQGRYALFHAGKAEKDWMIHRIDPPARERDPFPENVVPMPARLSQLPRDDGKWAVEVKWDGVRAIAYCKPGRVELQTRNLNDVSIQYPEVRRIHRALGSHDAVLDGEIVAFDEDGKPSFERLQQRIHNTDEGVIRRRMKTHPVVYVVFDLLYLDGRDLTGEPYSRRRELLEGLDLNGESWQTPGHSVGHAKELLAASKERGLEGVMLKRLDSTYAPGKRNGTWLKVKNVSRQEFVVGGWTPGEGRRKSQVGALLVGYFERDGGEPVLRYGGKVGTGFTEEELAALTARLAPLEQKQSPFGAGPKPPKGAHFVEPCLVAEVEFRQLTKEGMVRHGAYKGLREDKPAIEVGLELPADPREGPDDGDHPAAMVLDLDPAPPADVLDCAEVAIWLRGMFEQLGLSCCPATTGEGMEVLVPLNSETTYAQTKPFAKAVAETLEQRFGDRVATPASTAKQGGKVIVDWSRNDAEAGERPTVSTPLEWEEVEAALESGEAERLVFDHAAVLQRVEEKGDLFAPLLSEEQELPAI
jgi:bifunctional non-homologous end joining protein LigD